jgi:hypothetical protein
MTLRPTHGGDFLIGLAVGIVLSLPFWLLVWWWL